MDDSNFNPNDIIDKIIEQLKSINLSEKMHLHERYLHHMFSHMVQQYKGYEICFDVTEGKLHPEWATYIDEIPERHGGLYMYENNEYVICLDKKNNKDKKGGSSGFIDFAIGDYNNPTYAIEFKVAKSLNPKGYIFDYMKLLDSKNNFDNAISLSIIYGRKTPITSKYLTENIFDKATNKLGSERINYKRQIRFIVIQFINGGYSIWECNSINMTFKKHTN